MNTAWGETKWTFTGISSLLGVKQNGHSLIACYKNTEFKFEIEKCFC